MCDHGMTKTIYLDGKPVDVDGCLAGVILALNSKNVNTVASCCGHYNRPGNIALEDGRELILVPDYETGRKIDAMFPDIHGKVDGVVVPRMRKSPFLVVERIPPEEKVIVHPFNTAKEATEFFCSPPPEVQSRRSRYPSEHTLSVFQVPNDGLPMSYGPGAFLG